MTREDRMPLSLFKTCAQRFGRPIAFALLAMGFGLVAAGTASADQSYLKVSNRTLGVTQELSLEVNKSMIVDLPTNVGEVVVSQPTVATAIMRSKTWAIIQGAAGGDTNIFFLDGAGNNIAVLDIKVVQPRSDVGNALEAAIARNIPGSHITVKSVLLGNSTNRVVLSGTAISQDDVDKALSIAVQFAGDPKNVASIVSVAGNQQVILKVTVAEVNRTVVKQLGINLNVTGGGLITGLVNSPNDQLGAVSGALSPGQITASANIAGTQITATLDALARRNALRTLAEPVLTAMSGQSASFLAGGEFPYAASDGNGHVITNFKQYGVQLNFTPTVKSNGSIGLAVDTTVSEPGSQGAVTERSAKTTVEVPVGSTLTIGGLIQDTEKQQISGMPGLGDIPILGTLFRSRDFINDETELIVTVTPVLARTGAPTLPTDATATAGDAEAIFLGHMEKMYGVGTDGMRGSYSGSVGFVLD